MGHFTPSVIATAATAAFVATLAVTPRALAADESDFYMVAPNTPGVSLLHIGNQSQIGRNPFLNTSLGTNGRACLTCHQPGEGMTVTPSGLQRRFQQSNGNDAAFRGNDGSNCFNVTGASQKERKSAFSLLLNKGLFRIEMPMPANAEFSLVSVDDPYKCASTQTAGALSLYRRPMPTANLKFNAAVMWDGRETLDGKSVPEDLAHQAHGAILGHAAASQEPTDRQIASIVDLETAVYLTQAYDYSAGMLNAEGAKASAQRLASQDFFIGINDAALLAAKGLTPVPTFDLYDSWQKYADMAASSAKRVDRTTAARAAIYRGQQLFNTRKFSVTLASGKVIQASCAGCHDSPNAGSHSTATFFNVGVAAVEKRTADLPLFTFVCDATGATVKTTDPGRAMVTGKCADIGSFKPPVLRGLASRAPYFHNGAAAKIEDVVDFYDGKFSIGFTAGEKSDVAAFLKAL
jgi:cytochrome c peroxidase